MPAKSRNRISRFLLGLSLAAVSLAGCAHHPPPVAMAPPPPPPVGHPYQVMVEVPAPTRHIRMSAEQQQEVQQAFNVIALKSALMVAALTCNQQDQYDQFMTTFQPHVLAEQHVMDAYFRRIGGYAGRAKEDDFVTLLANNQSVSGIGQGSMFCLNNTAEYKAVLALKSYSDLDNFVTDLPPNATMVADAATVTPLSPNEARLHVAVVQSSHHVHLVRLHHLREHEAHTLRHHSETATVAANAAKPARPVAATATASGAMASGKAVNVAAVAP